MFGIFGTINAPFDVENHNDYFSGPSGFFLLISNLFKMAGYIAGLFFLFQLIKAGYSYMSASGDPKKTELAWAKIWQSLIGIIIVASAFIITGVIGQFLNIDFLSPKLYGPNGEITE